MHVHFYILYAIRAWLAYCTRMMKMEYVADNIFMTYICMIYIFQIHHSSAICKSRSHCMICMFMKWIHVYSNDTRWMHRLWVYTYSQLQIGWHRIGWHAATHCNTLQHAATRCNTLQHTATRCSTLFVTADRNQNWEKCARTHKKCAFHMMAYALSLQKYPLVMNIVAVCCSVLQCVAVCCSVLQCVPVCCSVLQRVAVWCTASVEPLLCRLRWATFDLIILQFVAFC